MENEANLVEEFLFEASLGFDVREGWLGGGLSEISVNFDRNKIIIINR